MRIKASRTRLMLAVAVGAVLLGITIHAAVSQVIAVGTIAHSDLFGGAATVTMRKLTIAPVEVLGWHCHPGIGAYTIVTRGTLVVEDGCGGEQVYAQGEAFFEPPNRVHRGRNLTAERSRLRRRSLFRLVRRFPCRPANFAVCPRRWPSA